MAHAGLGDPDAYRDGGERLRILEKVAPYLQDFQPRTHGRPSAGALKFSSILHDGESVESVVLKNREGRESLCLSTQSGCRMGCAFCATGSSGFRRNLDAAEIVGQAISARRDFGARPGSIVLMGMGEPLDNYDASIQALRILSDPRGLGLPITRMTLSTAGLAPGIDRLSMEKGPRPKLALSLHAAEDGLRTSLMPVNRAFPLGALKRSLRRYAERTGQDIFVEYLLLSGLNDSDCQARELARYLGGLPVRVNLMSYNETGIPGFSASPPERAAAFKRTLIDAGLFVHSRHSKGAEARAACGQLGLGAVAGSDGHKKTGPSDPVNDFL